jgi:hypothetical protein
MTLDLISVLLGDVTLFLQLSDDRGLVPPFGLRWGTLVPLVLTGNLILAVLAWFIVAMISKLI